MRKKKEGVKKLQKVGVKRFFFDFFAREKTPKSAKAGYHGQFEFHVKKKNPEPVDHVYLKKN